MAREINRLTARKVGTLAAPGRHADGGGLYLVVDPSGAKRWVFLYRFGGKRREMGLGSINAVPLVAAREKAAQARTSIDAGVDPINAKERPTAKPRKAFSEVAEAFLADHEPEWKNDAHKRQWRQTLEDHAASLWPMPIADISTEDVLKVLRPIWREMPDTARRLRGRIERVIDAAIAQGEREAANPARWKGHLSAILPRVAKLQRGHHAALPYKDVPAFYAELCRLEAQSAAALRLLILTVGRSGEIRGARGLEVSLKTVTWTVPAHRMKGKKGQTKEHRIPLSKPAVTLLKEWMPDDADALIFATRKGTELSDMVFKALFRRMKKDGITAHGFRSSFRDWVHAETDFPRELAEEALAHQIGSEVERAYLRGEALNKRRHLMDAWARFVASAQSAP